MTDPLAPFELLLGTWRGLGTGIGGPADVVHTYRRVVLGRFIQMDTRSIGHPGDDGTPGDHHEDITIFSFDSDRDAVVMRQFVSEGYVNTYVLEVGGNGDLVFTTEHTESGGGLQARITYRIEDDGYVEVLDLAEPGGDWFECRRQVMRRES